MGELVDLVKYRKAKQPAPQPPQVIAAHMVVEDMRATMYALPSDKARIELAQMLIAVLIQWVIKSNYYERPADVIRSWVNRKVDQYTKRQSEG